MKQSEVVGGLPRLAPVAGTVADERFAESSCCGTNDIKRRDQPLAASKLKLASLPDRRSAL